MKTRGHYDLESKAQLVLFDSQHRTVVFVWLPTEHRRSIAEQGGCFQRGVSLFVSLSVSLSVCQHDNFRTIRRTMMKVGG